MELINVPESAEIEWRIDCDAPHDDGSVAAVKMLWRPGKHDRGEWMGLCGEHVEEALDYERSMHSYGDSDAAAN